MNDIFDITPWVLALTIIITIVRSNRQYKRKLEQPNSAKKDPSLSAWVLPLLIAFFLSVFGSSVIALFLLGVVWIMRKNPQLPSREIPYPSDAERKTARGTYTWLFFSPIFNVFIFALAVFNLSSRSSTNARELAALVPLLLHLPVLLRLDPRRPFVFRHTQQAVFLLALRAGNAALALQISRYPEDGIWLFLLGNGFLWLFGSIWGYRQADRGTGWWIKRKGEEVISPTIKPKEGTPPEEDINALVNSLNAEGKTTRQKALSAFRMGTPDVRKKAIAVLKNIGEVETF